MALISAGGYGAGAPSQFTLPLNGRPWADLQLAARSLPWQQGDAVEVAVQGGPTYRMTVQHIGPRGGFMQVRLIGGSGGLAREVSAKQYRDIEAITVLRELLEECGEVPGTLSLPGRLPTWVRPAGPAHEALRALMMRYPSHVWQLAPDGRVHVGAPDWRDHEQAFPVESEDSAAGTFTGMLTPSLLPGVRLTMTRGEEKIVKRVTRVTHSMERVYAYPNSQTRLRTTVGTGDGQDRGVSGLEAVARRALHWVDYLGLYDCEIIRDHGDHTLDLRPMHPSLPELTRVRLVQPLPGAKVRLRAGGVVLLSFQGADPSRPVALHYGLAELELLEVATGRGQLLRLDDDRGQKSPDDSRYQRPHVLVQDAAGQRVELWAEPGAERVTVQDSAGQRIELDSAQNTLTIKGGQSVKIESSAEVTIKAVTANIDAGTVLLAGGGPPVARVGDTITGTCPAGPVTGIITSGSPKVQAG